jgi:hypothetical protein
MWPNWKLILWLAILPIIFLLTSSGLKGQTCCDSSSVFFICEELPSPSISLSQLEEVLNSSIDLKNKHINDGDIIKIIFIINCKGEDFNYKTLQPIDSTLKDQLFQIIHSNVKWIPGQQAHRRIDFWQTLSIIIESGKFRILDQDGTTKKKKRIN